MVEVQSLCKIFYLFIYFDAKKEANISVCVIFSPFCD